MKRLFYSVITLLLTVAVFVTVTYSWFTNTEFVEPDLSGFSVSAYFGGGTGTPDDPFQIKNQRHLYNLAWLQYLGYFNKEGILDDDGRIDTTSEGATSHMTQYSFIIATSEDTLDMDGWYLPPIGTSLRPFIGSLDGNGKTITNLNTTNNFSEFGTRRPSTVTSSNFANVEIIGFIGAIGKVTETMENSDKTITTTSDAISVHNLTLQDCAVSTYSDTTLIGSVAGYVNGTISDVGVKDPILNVYSNEAIKDSEFQNLAAIGSRTTSNLSDYTVAGYAESAYYTATTKNNTVIYNPTTSYSHFTYYGMGDNDNWGGSIDMSSLYSRINSVINSTELPSYVTDEINYYDIDGDLTNHIEVTATPSSTNDYAHYYYSNGSSGAYLTQRTAPYNGYDYLTGLYKDVITVEVTGTTSGYKFKNLGGNYLNITSTRNTGTVEFNTTISTNTSSASATVWVRESEEGDYQLYAYNPDDGRKYYLTTTNYSSLSLTTTKSEIWKLDSNYGYYTENNSTKYYIRFINGSWTVSNQLAYYITDGTNYLTRVSNSNNITNETSASSATRWIFENEGTNPSGIIYDESNTNYKLCIYNNALSARTNTTTSWSNNGTLLYNGSNYIIYNGSNWTLYQPNQFYIKYDNYYLTLNDDGSINNNVTDEGDATKWTFSNNTSLSGYISTVINNTTYYLRFNNGSFTTTSTYNQRTSWSKDDNGIYYTQNNSKYYILYSNGTWTVANVNFNTGYKISYNGNYLNNNGTSGITSGTSSGSATIWYVDSNNHIYCVINNTNYYLYYSNWNNSILSISTSSNQSYMPQKTNNYLITTSYYSSYYVYYSKGWKDTSTQTELDFEEIVPKKISINSIELPYESKTSVAKPNMSIESNITTNTYKRSVKSGVPSVFNYIPLNTDDNNVVTNTNTGYIMSGGHSGNSGSLSNVDIRVAGNATSYNYSRISTSYDADTDKLTNVYTYDAKGLRIFDDKDVEETSYSYYYDDNNTFTYQKYSVSKKSLETTLSQHESAIGGIHFITSLISMDNLITAPSVMINGDTCTDYQMPENSIDFNLKTKGYINFFATLYYPGNTTFFSLYDIKRTADKKTIVAINHIEAIYQNSNDKGQDYVYLYESPDPITGSMYSNGASSLPSYYVKIFDTNWIETPTFNNSTDFESSSSGSGYKNGGRYMKKIFYFEIPINSGEYALGSVDQRDGGYLLYLDIGANASVVDRTEITQKSVTTVYDYKYVNGIQILDADNSATGSSISALDSAVAIIPATDSDFGVLTISRTDDDETSSTITFSKSVVSNYKGDEITLSGATLKALNGNGNGDSTVRSVLKYLDFDRTSERLYQTTVNNDGSGNTSYDVYRLNTTTFEKTGEALDTNEMALPQRKLADYGLLYIDENYSGVRNDSWSSITVNPSSDPSILDYYFNVPTSDKSKIAEEIVMNFAKVTSSDSTVYNLDPNVANISVTNGKIVLNEPNNVVFTVENAYRLAGNDAIVTFNVTAANQVEIIVKSVNNGSGSYTFKINGVTVANNAEYSTVVPTT